MTDEQFERIVAATAWDDQAVETINTMLGVFERNLKFSDGYKTAKAIMAAIRSEGPAFFRQQYRAALEKQLPVELIDEIIAGLETPALQVWSKSQTAVASTMSKAGEEWGLFVGARVAVLQKRADSDGASEPPLVS